MLQLDWLIFYLNWKKLISTLTGITLGTCYHPSTSVEITTHFHGPKCVIENRTMWPSLSRKRKLRTTIRKKETIIFRSGESLLNYLRVRWLDGSLLSFSFLVLCDLIVTTLSAWRRRKWVFDYLPFCIDYSTFTLRDVLGRTLTPHKVTGNFQFVFV